MKCYVNPDDNVRDELDIRDMLHICGHTALGLPLSIAREIDPSYLNDYYYVHQKEKPKMNETNKEDYADKMQELVELAQALGFRVYDHEWDCYIYENEYPTKDDSQEKRYTGKIIKFPKEVE